VNGSGNSANTNTNALSSNTQVGVSNGTSVYQESDNEAVAVAHQGQGQGQGQAQIGEVEFSSFRGGFDPAPVGSRSGAAASSYVRPTQSVVRPTATSVGPLIRGSRSFRVRDANRSCQRNPAIRCSRCASSRWPSTAAGPLDELGPALVH
jgi:hypothetical protein